VHTVTVMRFTLTSVRVAALDLGTNSFHLLVADVHRDGHLEPLVREKEMLRLGDVVSKHGSIPPAAADQAIATVRRFRLLADAAGATELLAKATSAIRRASNGADLVDRIEEETGVPVDVISGHEEARLIFNAIRASVVLDPAPAICFDLGGGSLEVMVGDARGMQWATSVPLGVARLTAELVHSDPLSKRDRRALRDRIVEELAPAREVAEQFRPRLAVGSSGTLECLAQMVAARRDEDPSSLNQLTLTRQELEPLHKEIIGSSASERLRMPGLDARRVDLVVAGSMLLTTVMEEFDLDALTISEWALREGIVLDAVGRHANERSDDPRAIRRESVLSLARRCNWPERHSRQVASLALELFDATADLHGLDDHDRELLDHAALLHDIGEHVSSAGHHRHSAYLVRNGQLRGFAPEEIELLAAIVRWHRSGDPRVSDEFPLLDGDTIARVRALTAILRLADGLDRSREQHVYGLDAMTTPSLVLLRLRTHGDAELEIWGARRKRALFEKLFQREVEFTAHPAFRGMHDDALGT
jgi:exopolyphosphatase / guanosine-5'-triphosphate,3'-diphosphate pyrophosphatase